MRTLTVNWQILPPFSLKNMMDCYIYFKAGTALEEKVIAAEKSLQQLVLAQLAIKGKVQRRPESTNDLHTWMEVYANVSADFAAKLEKLVQQTGLAKLQYSERRTEYFLDVDVCA